MRKYAEVGDIVTMPHGMPHGEFMGWPRMLVEDVYDKQIAEKKIVRMVLVSWFDKNHDLRRGEFRQELLVVCDK